MLILDDNLMDQIAGSEHAGEYLILEPHPDYPGQWIVNSLEPGFLFDFIDIIGPYRAVSPGKIEAFQERAKEKNYHVVFAQDPAAILAPFERLNEPPGVTINSTLPNTIEGFLPYQLQGFNYLKELDAGVALWSTGTGKSVLANALVKFHAERGEFDYAWFVVKAHNKINTQRSLSRLADIDSVVLDGPQKRREEIIGGLTEEPATPKVIVTNYEKLRIDLEQLLPLFERRLLIIWDEMPSKLKNRKTNLYKAVRKLLYRKVNLSERRPEALHQYMLSATPIENSPEDWFNCVRLLDPSIYGSIQEFHDDFVASYSFYTPDQWKDLDRMGMKAAHIVHQVDKESPDIATQFPRVIETPLYIDWHPDDRAVYDLLLDEARKIADPLAAITVMQMLCDAPSVVSNSAALRRAYEDAVAYSDVLPRRTGSEACLRLTEALPRFLDDSTHTKLQTLRQLLTEDHKKEKIIVFSAFNEALLPILESHMVDWGVSYVKFNGSEAEKQIAQDYFTNESWVQVFLTSDMGSDSISLEQASVVIDYDLPWKWSTLIQRHNRAHRITSNHRHVRFYSLMMADSVEERKRDILERKRGFHDSVFKGAITEQSEAQRLTKEDLAYILG